MTMRKAPIPVDRIITEIRELITCHWCNDLAEGLANDSTGESYPSCGTSACGTDFVSGRDNSYFQTRDNLLEIAIRCSRAETALEEITGLARKCEYVHERLEEEAQDASYGLGLRYSGSTIYQNACEELWQTVIDLTSQ